MFYTEKISDFLFNWMYFAPISFFTILPSIADLRPAAFYKLFVLVVLYTEVILHRMNNAAHIRVNPTSEKCQTLI